MWLRDLGRSFQRIGVFLMLAALVGLPFAVILPHRPGLVLLIALFLAALLRLSRPQHRS